MQSVADRVCSSNELAEELKNVPPQKFYKFGMVGLDTLIGEFGEGDFIVIAGE